MESNDAIGALNALGHETRLAVFRLLVRNLPNGVPAGQIAEELGVKHSTLSANLAALQGAGLINSARDGRSILYTADIAHMRALLTFLMADCCGGDSEICAPLLDTVCCTP